MKVLNSHDFNFGTSFREGHPPWGGRALVLRGIDAWVGTSVKSPRSTVRPDQVLEAWTVGKESPVLKTDARDERDGSSILSASANC